MEETPRWYDAHLEDFQKVAFIKSREEYDQLYRRSIEDPDGFWAEQAKAYLSWDKSWDFVLRYDFNEAKILGVIVDVPFEASLKSIRA